MRDECANGKPYINNLGGGGSQDCVGLPECAERMIYFRNVLDDWPLGSNQRVDLKITLLPSLAGYSLNYDQDHTDYFGATFNGDFGRQGCAPNGELIGIYLFGVSGAFNFEFVREDRTTPVVFDSFVMSAFDIDMYDSGRPNYDQTSVVSGYGLSRYHVHPSTQLCQLFRGGAPRDLRHPIARPGKGFSLR